MTNYLRRCTSTRTCFLLERHSNYKHYKFPELPLQYGCFSHTAQNFRKHYETLEVAPDATQKQIKSQFYKLSKKYHPDMNLGDEKAHAQFLKINEAYSVLIDDGSRREYDRSIRNHRRTFRPRGNRQNFNNTSSDSYHKHHHYRYGEGASQASHYYRPNARSSGRNSGNGNGFHFHGQKKSPEFNFDEHFQRHYGQELRHTERERKKNLELMEEYRKQHQIRKLGNLVTFASLIFIFTSALTFASAEGSNYNSKKIE
ncbi:1719_t:CDS:1 [Ambispora gerdemannii]|uniref:1719_t:CDS:1 n=1 Tax=Ambispora gerdemannii TaxID=144530 RepID=A0A9N8WE19_9GLOM|nr:1719_t:CDS:1 [Ambispora gerdemannii]